MHSSHFWAEISGWNLKDVLWVKDRSREKLFDNCYNDSVFPPAELVYPGKHS